MKYSTFIRQVIKYHFSEKGRHFVCNSASCVFYELEYKTKSRRLKAHYKTLGETLHTEIKNYLQGASTMEQFLRNTLNKNFLTKKELIEARKEMLNTLLNSALYAEKRG